MARSLKVILASALLLAMALQVVAVYRQSLSGDGAYHLVAGHQALRYGQNRVNLEHPPLAKMVMSLPSLWLDEPLAQAYGVKGILEVADGIFLRPEVVKSLTVQARWVVLVLFVVPFGIALFGFGRTFGGCRVGTLLVLLVFLSLSVLPYLTVLQTDVPVSLGYLLVILAGWRLVERNRRRDAVLLGLALGFSIAVKYSGLLLAPTVLLALFLARRPGEGWARLLGQFALVAAAAWVVVDSSYAAANWNYDSAAGRETVSTYCEGRGTLVVGDQLKDQEASLLKVEAFQPRLAQWLTGLQGIRAQNRLGIYPSYAFGEVRYTGSWWYFPVLFLVKTPLVILAVMVLLMPSMVRSVRKETWRSARLLLPLSILLVYVWISVSGNYNLGIRHLMPVMGILFLPVAVGLARRPIMSGAVVILLAVESAVLAPLWMSATNTWMLGDKNPTRFSLGAGNLEYRQNFIELGRIVEERALNPVTVIYPPLRPHVITAYLPEASVAEPGDDLAPGWYALNARVEQYIPAVLRHDETHQLYALAQEWNPYWMCLKEAGEDHGYVAGTFHLYYVP